MSSENKNNDYLLKVEHLKQYFPVHQGFSTIPLKAVDDISFAIRPGETLGLVGESGCGKTTVGRTLLRLYQPTAGKITFDGNVLFDSGEQYDENGKMIVDANGKPVMGKKVDVSKLAAVGKNLEDAENVEVAPERNVTTTFRMDKKMFQDLSLLKVYTGKNKQDMIYDYIKEGVERDKKKYGVS